MKGAREGHWVTGGQQQQRPVTEVLADATKPMSVCILVLAEVCWLEVPEDALSGRELGPG